MIERVTICRSNARLTCSISVEAASSTSRARHQHGWTRFLRDNVFVAWLEVAQYEEASLRAMITISEVFASISRYLACYKVRMPQSSLGKQNPKHCRPQRADANL
jgi:hypothetical protein